MFQRSIEVVESFIKTGTLLQTIFGFLIGNVAKVVPLSKWTLLGQCTS